MKQESSQTSQVNKLSFREKFRNKISVLKENNPSAFIFLMIILVNILSVMLSSLLLLFLPENKDRNFLEMMRFAFTLMINPSGRYQYSDYPISLIITTVVVLLGMISLTGGTVGYITNVINQILEKSAHHKNKLRISNHIVILNYNHKVPSLIYDYCFDEMENTYITILSEKSKEEIEMQIANVFSSHHKKNQFRNLIIRRGNPMSKLDLDHISLRTAKTVLLMTPDYDNTIDQSFFVSKLFMFVTWYFSADQNPCRTNIVVETANTNVETMVREYHLEQTNQISVPVNYNEILGKIMAVTAIMPSLNDVLLHMISFEGVEIYLKNISGSNSENLSIADEIRMQKTAVPLFDLSNRRVYIAENENEIDRLKSHKTEKIKKTLPEQKLIPCIALEKSEIIIIGINSKLPYILESLTCFMREYNDMQIHVILMDTEENKAMLEQYYTDKRYRKILNSPQDHPVIIHDIFNPLENLDISLLRKTNSILFLSDETCAASHMDEKPLLFWSKLKDIENFNARDCIVEILDMQNKDIIQCRNKDQVIVSDKFLSCMYAQIGKDPARLDVIKDLITFQEDASVQMNECNLFAVKSGIFFRNYTGDLQFASKRELISWVYEATGQAYMPLGCIKNGIHYLFARMDQNSDDLDSAILYPKDEGKPFLSPDQKITLEPDDEMIFLKF
ncbi:MAG: hypothetical protein K2H82_05780 [Oscillospiraceae bacterium]|nr:hypothetical protein [Oscillospiraceae bacterium]